MSEPSASAFGTLVAQTAGVGSSSALITFLIYTLAVFAIAWFSNRMRQSKSFLSEYFLGSRSLGVWAFALTFAATSASGGSFTGFPSKIYSHGWVLAVWIASYMIVPICTMGLLAKRINQVARKTGAITVPDVLRDRFNSASLGLLATLLIVFFMAFNLVAQFKAGSLILRTLLADVPLFNEAAKMLGQLSQGTLLSSSEGSAYQLCLFSFAAAVIIYTTYGGFHAVVWTDVMQGVVMIVGVLILLPLALSQVGGLSRVNEQLREMTPPRLGTARVVLDEPPPEDVEIRPATLFMLPGEPTSQDATPRILRTSKTAVIRAGTKASNEVPVLEFTTPAVIDRMVLAFEEQRQNNPLPPVELDISVMKDYASGANQPGTYIVGPGPDAERGSGFLPLSLAISFFVMWAISGAGQPSNMVRLMAFNNTNTLRRAIFTVSIYYTLIYLPLVIIFCCARIFLPGMEQESDRIMPAAAVTLTANAGWAWLGGLLLAAPFAAVMSTVDSFLLMISSALVRDVYQRNINPNVSEQNIKRMSYTVTCVVGVAAMLGAMHPPQFLQDIIVYTGSGLAACFLVPVVLALYWPRYNGPGAIAGMVGGFAVHLALYLSGWQMFDTFRAYTPLGVDPIIWGLLASFTISVATTHLTPPPDEHLVHRYFYVDVDTASNSTTS